MRENVEREKRLITLSLFLQKQRPAQVPNGFAMSLNSRLI